MIEDDLDPYEGYEPRVRPSKSGSKPRSKNRPQHEDAKQGLVIAVDRGRYRVILEENIEGERLLTCTRARELRSQAIVTGDIVDVVGDTTGAEGSLARIVRIHPRKTVLRRSADDSDTFERIIVANADQLLMVVAAASPEPRMRLVDRYLVAALDAGIIPILCITKTDLASGEELRRYVQDAGVQVVEHSKYSASSFRTTSTPKNRSPRRPLLIATVLGCQRPLFATTWRCWRRRSLLPLRTPQQVAFRLTRGIGSLSINWRG
jgi:ribosome biogenesis GTPase / thiamine phosphate phosphatase